LIPVGNWVLLDAMIATPIRKRKTCVGTFDARSTIKRRSKHGRHQELEPLKHNGCEEGTEADAAERAKAETDFFADSEIDQDERGAFFAGHQETDDKTKHRPPQTHEVPLLITRIDGSTAEFMYEDCVCRVSGNEALQQLFLKPARAARANRSLVALQHAQGIDMAVHNEDCKMITDLPKPSSIESQSERVGRVVTASHDAVRRALRVVQQEQVGVQVAIGGVYNGRGAVWREAVALVGDSSSPSLAQELGMTTLSIAAELGA